MPVQERREGGMPLTRFGQELRDIGNETFVPYRTLVPRRMLKEGIAEMADRMIVDKRSVVAVVQESHSEPVVREIATAIGTHIIVHTKKPDTYDLEQSIIKRLNRAITEDLASEKRPHSV